MFCEEHGYDFRNGEATIQANQPRRGLVWKIVAKVAGPENRGDFAQKR